MQSNTENIAKFRGKKRASEKSDERLKEQNRIASKKYRMRVKNRIQRLEDAVALHEKELFGNGSSIAKPEVEGQTMKAPIERKIYLPSREQLERMSLEDLAEWKKAQRRERNRARRSVQSSKEKEKISSLEARLAFLTGVSALANFSLVASGPLAAAEEGAGGTGAIDASAVGTAAAEKGTGGTSAAEEGTGVAAAAEEGLGGTVIRTM